MINVSLYICCIYLHLQPKKLRLREINKLPNDRELSFLFLLLPNYFNFQYHLLNSCLSSHAPHSFAHGCLSRILLPVSGAPSSCCMEDSSSASLPNFMGSPVTLKIVLLLFPLFYPITSVMHIQAILKILCLIKIFA